MVSKPVCAVVKTAKTSAGIAGRLAILKLSFIALILAIYSADLLVANSDLLVATSNALYVLMKQAITELLAWIFPFLHLPSLLILKHFSSDISSILSFIGVTGQPGGYVVKSSGSVFGNWRG